MDKKRWARIENLFATAVELDSAERESFLKASCGDDVTLCEEILSLLAEDARPNKLFDDTMFENGLQLLIRSSSCGISPGQQFGQFRILRPIAAGGMGEVFLAEDQKLQRKVALKFLAPTAASAGIINEFRFTQEALSASKVAHPNVAHIYEIDVIDGRNFIAMEYIEGETLRKRLKEGKLSVQEILEISLQVVHALAAAHQAGVIHRDVKPENIIIGADNHVKVLDFGLAKWTRPNSFTAATLNSEIKETREFRTSPEILMGTISYMSPEQLRCEEPDFRSDIWSFGVLLFEMLVGKVPFQSSSTADTISRILNEKPVFPQTFKNSNEVELVKLIKRCLNKDPKLRFQSARDLAFAMEIISQTSNTGGLLSPLHLAFHSKEKRLLALALFGSILILTAGVFRDRIFSIIGVAAGGGSSSSSATAPTAEEKPLPEYHQVTFNRGTVWSARFVPGDQLIIYTATWNGEKLNVFFSKPSAGPETKSMDLPETNLLSVSSKGELALLKPQRYLYQFIQRGVLQQLPMGGKSPRSLTENVQEADWTPDGSNLVIVRYFVGGNRIEYPINKVLWETSGYLSSPRFSADGKQIAFLEHPTRWDNRGYVSVIDAASGARRVLTDEWSGLEGLAWNEATGEIWFSASKAGENYSLYAVTPQGRVRRIENAPVNLMLHDISKSGEVLLSRAYQFTKIYRTGIGEEGTSSSSSSATGLKDFSWLHLVGISDFSADGQKFLLTHFGQGSGTNYKVYLGSITQEEPVLLGDGRAMALSPDNNFVLVKLSRPENLVVLSVGTGEKRVLPQGDIEQYDRADWFPDGKEILFTARLRGEKLRRCFAQNLSTGEIRPLTPEGIIGTLVSPDGKTIIVRNPNGERMLFQIENGRLSPPLQNISNEEEVIGWADDNQSLFIFRPLEMPIKIHRVNTESGRKTLFTTVNPEDKAGIFGPAYLFVTPDGKNVLYGLRKYLFDMFVAENLN